MATLTSINDGQFITDLTQAVTFKGSGFGSTTGRCGVTVGSTDYEFTVVSWTSSVIYAIPPANLQPGSFRLGWVSLPGEGIPEVPVFVGEGGILSGLNDSRNSPNIGSGDFDALTVGGLWDFLATDNAPGNEDGRYWAIVINGTGSNRIYQQVIRQSDGKHFERRNLGLWDTVVTSGSIADFLTNYAKLNGSESFTGVKTFIGAGSKPNTVISGTDASFTCGDVTIAPTDGSYKLQVNAPSGTENATGDAVINGLLAINGPVAFKDLSAQNSPASMTYVGDDLSFNGQKLNGTAAGKDIGTGDGDAAGVANDAFTPALESTTGTTVTPGVSATYDGDYVLVGPLCFVQININFDDAAASPVVGDRIKIEGVPAEAQPSGSSGYKASGLANLDGGILTDNATYLATSYVGRDDFFLECINISGSPNYGDPLSIRMSYMV